MSCVCKCVCDKGILLSSRLSPGSKKFRLILYFRTMFDYNCSFCDNLHFNLTELKKK